MLCSLILGCLTSLFLDLLLVSFIVCQELLQQCTEHTHQYSNLTKQQFSVKAKGPKENTVTNIHSIAIFLEVCWHHSVPLWLQHLHPSFRMQTVPFLPPGIESGLLVSLNSFMKFTLLTPIACSLNTYYLSPFTLNMLKQTSCMVESLKFNYTSSLDAQTTLTTSSSTLNYSLGHSTLPFNFYFEFSAWSSHHIAFKHDITIDSDFFFPPQHWQPLPCTHIKMLVPPYFSAHLFFPSSCIKPSADISTPKFPSFITETKFVQYKNIWRTFSNHYIS